jgi:hypothetical protein
VGGGHEAFILHRDHDAFRGIVAAKESKSLARNVFLPVPSTGKRFVVILGLTQAYLPAATMSGRDMP